jgi:transposase
VIHWRPTLSRPPPRSGPHYQDTTESGGAVPAEVEDPHHPRQPLGAQNQGGPRFSEGHPQVRLHFTPTYSSWLNQVETWFAKIERDVIARGVFTSVPDLARKPRRYINAYSANVQSFRWKYSDVRHRIRSLRSDCDRPLVRCPGHTIIDTDPSDNYETETVCADLDRRTT